MTYQELLNAHVLAGDGPGARELLEDMSKCLSSPVSSLYRFAFCRQKFTLSKSPHNLNILDT